MALLILIFAFDVTDQGTNGSQVFCIFVRYFYFKLFLYCHKDFEQIQRIYSQIALEQRIIGYLAIINPKLFNDDFFYVLPGICCYRCISSHNQIFKLKNQLHGSKQPLY